MMIWIAGCQTGQNQALNDQDLESSGSEDQAQAQGDSGEGYDNQDGGEGSQEGAAYNEENGGFNQAEAGAGDQYGNQTLGDQYGQGTQELFENQGYGNTQFNESLSNQPDSETIPPEEEQMSAEELMKPEAELPLATGLPGEANEFSGVPYIPGTLRNMADGEAPEEYIVEYGDTLFDICSQLLGEGEFWPKLWSLNPYIKNPHFIWPGMRLRFYPGDEEEPPFIEVVQEEEMLPVPDSNLEVDKMVTELVLPERSDLNIKPTDVVGRDDIGEIEGGFDTVGNIFNSDQVQLTLPGFVFPKEEMGQCIVTGGAMGEFLIGEDRRFVCQGGEEQEEMAIGSSYTAIRRMSEVVNPETDEPSGYLYQFVAHVKLTNQISENKMYLGEVTKSRLGLQRGDIILSYQSTKRFVSLSQVFSNPGKANARIIGFDLAGQSIGGQGSMVFLDKGRDAGVSPGQLLQIDQSMQYFVKSYNIDDSFKKTVPVGFLRVVDVTDTGAVGYVVYNTQEILLGDIAGKG